MKKTFFAASSVYLLLGFAPAVFAQGFVPLAVIPGLTDASVTSVVNSDSLAVFFNNLYKYAIGFAAVLAIIEIIWGGLEISTKDSVSKNQDGKERIRSAIFGLVLVLSPALVFSIINPAILNLSLNLPPLDTRSRAVNNGAVLGTPAATQASCPTGAGVEVTGPCVQQRIDQCTKDGGTPSLSTGNSAGTTIVTCTPKVTVTSTDTLTSSLCATFIKSGITVLGTGGAEYWPAGDCSSTHAQQSLRLYGSKGLICNPVAEGGVCLYYPPRQ